VFQPKHFYRELERLLHERSHDSLSPAWFRWLVEEIVHRFGDALLIESGRLYEEELEEYRIVHDVGSRDPHLVGLGIPLDYRPLQLVLTHKSFIFDRTVEGQSEALEARLGGLESAAFRVKSVPRYILAFGLRPGWQRDDLDFALNTLRNAIDLRVTVQGLRTDIEQAAEIQQSLLPQFPPDLPGYSIAARSIPAERVGGDFYDFLVSNDGAVLIAVGDASGHGLGAALLARDTVTGIRMGAERLLRITEIVRRLNRVIARSALSSRFVSLFYGDLEANGDIFYVNAGHPPAWLVGASGVRRLDVGGTILGPIDTQTFRRGWAHMEPGDTLAVLTDGFLERTNRVGGMFGDEGVEAILKELRGRPAEEILERLFAEAAGYGNGKPWEDDITAVVVTRAAV
jgi:sigma-B regulation protein RsbU (phosphoserine phosphatase)